MYHIIDKNTGNICAYVSGSFAQAIKKALKYGPNAIVKFATDKAGSHFMRQVELEVKAYESEQASL